ncbi:MAG: tetratricopeptide repeat protein [Cyclobacteriaceae bacterium]|nr:tetratricopeptide repeat protein [Cyclobacteriaceae bacterium]
MQPTNNIESKRKWCTLLSVLFLLLFAIFWSLGSFFFWTLLGLSISFGAFALSYSGVTISFFNNPTRNQNPFQSRPSNFGATDSHGQAIQKKVFRTFAIIGGVIFIFIIIGLFSSDEESQTSEPVEIESSSTSAVTETDNSFNSKGTEYFDKGQYDSALYFYNKSLEINPDDIDATYNKALAYFMKEDYRKSISIVKKCLQQNEDYNPGWWLLGDDYYSVREYDSAIISLQRAYNNQYEEPGFLQLFGNAYLKQGNNEKAKEFYLKVIEQDTTQADVYRQLIQLDPENANEYRSRASALEKNSR